MRARVEKVDGRIHLNLPYMDGEGSMLAKMIPGARPKFNHGTFIAWSYPLDMSICYALRDQFGPDLVIGPALRRWARNQKVTLAEISETRTLPLDQPVDLPRVREQLPRMWEAMQAKGFQTVGTKFLTLVKRGLLADSPGLGKSIQALAALVEADARNVLVLAPSKAASKTWPDEIEKWMTGYPGNVEVFVTAGLTRQERVSQISAHAASTARMRVLVCNTEMASLIRVRTCKLETCDGMDYSCENVKRHKNKDAPGRSGYWQLFERAWDAILGDETHLFLIHANPRAKKTSQVGYGLQKLRSTPDGLRIALTGTPMRGKPRLVWPTLHWLRPDLYTSQHRWQETYFEFEYDHFAFGHKKVTDEVRPEKEADLAEELGRLMIRRTKAELRAINLAWAPPPKEYPPVWVNLEDSQLKQYRQIEKGVAANLRGGGTFTAEGALAEMTRLKQLASFSLSGGTGTLRPTLPSAKFDWLVAFLTKLGITGKADTADGSEKVIVATQFAQFARLISQELSKLGIKTGLITGDSKKADVNRTVDRFQADDSRLRVMILSTKAGGVSLTLDRADHVVIMDETWIVDEQLQVEDRAHRVSRPDHLISVWYIRASNTIDEAVGSKNELMDISQHRVLDAARGLEYARKLKERT